MYNKGQLVPLESWDDVVGPGLCVVLKLWTSDSIQFLDALGRRFKFPWNIIRTWNVSRCIFPNPSGFLSQGYEYRG